MLKGLSGLKKVVKGGFSAVAEHSSTLAEQVVTDPTTSKDYLKDSIKKKVQGGVATVLGAGESVLDSDSHHTKEKVGEYAHNIKHYGAFGEDYLGYSDPTKELRKAVKQKEKAAKKARKDKKKKTGKKEDLFDPENLAKYKKELEEKRRLQEEAEKAAARASDSPEDLESEKENKDSDPEPRLKLDLADPNKSESEASANPTPVRTPLRSPAQTPKDNEDWRAFQSLTTGVDFLIQKTKAKEEEFQKQNRKEVKVVDKTAKAEKERNLKKKKKWVNLETSSFDDFDGEVEQQQQHSQSELEEEGQEPVTELEVEPTEKGAAEVKEEEEEVEIPEDDDDIFNTDFVNAITSGDVKLAVIPDDPVYEDEDDPFNTAFADQVVKKQEEEKRKEESRLKFTGLSAVADVLSGKSKTIDKSAVEVTTRRKRRRANRINLIADDAEEVTAVEDIADIKVKEAPEADNHFLVGVDDNDNTALPIPDTELLLSTPSPCSTTTPVASEDQENNNKVDTSEFEVLNTSGEATELTSNVAILSGEFAKPVEEEEDEFDAAFDALAQESVTKSKLEELEKQFENDDIFDTSCADRVLNLASLIDKVEEKEEVEITFDDPFDTSAYEHITGEVETDLEFASLAKRETDKTLVAEPVEDPFAQKGVPDSSVFDPFPGTKEQSSDSWTAFEERKKPPRPAAPPRPAPRRPPPPPSVNIDPSSRPETPSVVVKAPSTESIKSWNNSVAENLIRKSEKEAAEALEEEEEEFDPFDTTEFESVAGKGIANYEDPFDTSAVEKVIQPDNQEDQQQQEEEKKEEAAQEEEEEESDNEEEEVPDPFEIISCIQGENPAQLGGAVIKPESKDITAEEVDPFDTSFAADILPNKGDPFDTSFVKGDPGKAEIKALEEEFLSDIPVKNSSTETPGVTGRARPKGSNIGDLSVKALEPEEPEEDPFDTSIADKVIPVRKAKKQSHVSVEDDDFDPTSSFQKSKEILEKVEEDSGPVKADPAAVQKVDSIDSDDFDPRAF